MSELDDPVPSGVGPAIRGLVQGTVGRHVEVGRGGRKLKIPC